MPFSDIFKDMTVGSTAPNWVDLEPLPGSTIVPYAIIEAGMSMEFNPLDATRHRVQRDNFLYNLEQVRWNITMPFPAERFHLSSGTMVIDGHNYPILDLDVQGSEAHSEIIFTFGSTSFSVSLNGAWAGEEIGIALLGQQNSRTLEITHPLDNYIMTLAVDDAWANPASPAYTYIEQQKFLVEWFGQVASTPGVMVALEITDLPTPPTTVTTPGPFEIYQPAKAPGFLQDKVSRAWNAELGHAKDVILDRAAESVRARVLALNADDGALQIGLERGIKRHPNESMAAYRSRVAGAWNTKPFAGTVKGLLEELTAMGYETSAVLEGTNAGNWSEFEVQVNSANVPDWNTHLTLEVKKRILKAVLDLKPAHCKLRQIAAGNSSILIYKQLKWGDEPTKKWAWAARKWGQGVIL